MKWLDYISHLRLEAQQQARKEGLAKIEMFYYGRQDGTVREIIRFSRQNEREFIENGIEED